MHDSDSIDSRSFQIMKYLSAIITPVLLLFSACNAVDQNRIPAMPVSINLADIGAWHTYGVAGIGQYRIFIRENQEPSNFPYTQTTYTGFGGVLLISGIDPFSGENGPLAYDLACPVERDPTIRIFINPDNLDAVCPVCSSHYNVIMSGGAPVSGPAADGKVKYALELYKCIPSQYGGYMITR